MISYYLLFEGFTSGGMLTNLNRPSFTLSENRNSHDFCILQLVKNIFS